MYGFTIAAWLAGIKKFDLYLNMMCQPPWDTRMNMTDTKPYYIVHYTYGMDYKLTGTHLPTHPGHTRHMHPCLMLNQS
jgi:hydroxyproline O-arabinosyltransferase